MQIRSDGKIIFMFTLLVIQVLIVMIYVTCTTPPKLISSTIQMPVSFVNAKSTKVFDQNQSTYNANLNTQSINEEITLKDTKASTFFQIYNHTLCWKEGVDDRTMRINVNSKRCVCNQGWHGSDCGQPEVVWRAVMASKQNVKLKRRKWMRRTVYTFCLNNYNSAISEIIVQELYNVVDLFVICDFSNTEDNFKYELAKGLLKRQQNKILYINTFTRAHKPAKLIFRYIWDKIHNVIKNFRDDDVLVMTDPEQILNSRALMFLKIYDGWSQPIGFRLRWLVFGFFWQHPSKTTIKKGACTVGLMREAYRTNDSVLQKELIDEVSGREALGLVIGDLNHYGGWYCHYCQAPQNIILTIKCKSDLQETNVEANIDVSYVEELIGMGVWLNGKTNLLRVSRSQDSYFAPEIVLNNTRKYDWLLQNFYFKLDYS